MRPQLDGRIGLAAILLVGMGLRVACFGSVPWGLNQDEASLGYDAFAILKYGMDRHGIHHPAFLIAWGSGMNALSAYLAMPFVALLGPTPVAIRLVNLLAGLASLYWFFALTKTIGGQRLAFWACTILALSPWHIMISRWGLESNLLPAVFLLAVLTFVKSIDRQTFLPIAGVFFGLALYAYGTAYLAVPLFLLLVLIWLLFSRREVKWAWLASGALALVLIALPIVATLVVNRFHWPSTSIVGIGIPRMTTVARYENISALFGDGVLARCWHNLGVLWRLVLKQDDGLPWNSMGDHGIFYTASLGFALIGIVVAAERAIASQGKEPSVVMIAWLFVALIVGCAQESNINRANLLWMPIIYFVAVGLDVVATDRGRVAALGAAFALFGCLFGYDYFANYNHQAKGAFFPGFLPALKSAAAGTTGPVCVTTRVNMPYVFALLAEESDPTTFARTVVYEGGGEFQGVRSFGRFTFGLERCDPQTHVFVAERGEAPALEASGTPVFVGERYVAIRMAGR